MHWMVKADGWRGRNRSERGARHKCNQAPGKLVLFCLILSCLVLSLFLPLLSVALCWPCRWHWYWSCFILVSTRSTPGCVASPLGVHCLLRPFSLLILYSHTKPHYAPIIRQHQTTIVLVLGLGMYNKSQHQLQTLSLHWITNRNIMTWILNRRTFYLKGCRLPMTRNMNLFMERLS